MRPAASEVVLARLNLFNYVGVVIGGAVSGLLGSTGQFRLAYAARAALALLLLAAARHFTQPPRGTQPMAARMQWSRVGTVIAAWMADRQTCARIPPYRGYWAHLSRTPL